MLASAAQPELSARVTECGDLASASFARSLFCCVFGLACTAAGAADLEEAEKLFRTGRYDECLRVVDEEIGNDGWSEPWRHLKIKSRAGAREVCRGDGRARRGPAPISREHVVASAGPRRLSTQRS